MSTVVANPFPRAASITVPAGTLVHSMNPRHDRLRVTRATRQVALDSTSPGYAQLWIERWRPTAADPSPGTVHLPEVTWAGAGGYWQRAQVTPELLAANGLPPLVLPELDAYERRCIGLEDGDDTLPSLEDGYTNRWAAPVT